MKKILCICNTYYQLIFAMQLKKTIYRDDYMVLFLSDHSKNTFNVCRRLKQSDCFEEVHYVETKDMDYTISSRNPFNGAGVAKKVLSEVDAKCFDELLFYNLSKFTYLVFSCLYRKNKNIITYKFEEGVLSYNFAMHKIVPLTSFWRVNRLLYYFRGVIRRWDILSKITGFYCFYPQLYKGELIAQKVDLIDKNAEVGQTIVETFVENNSVNPYKEKYIFFTSVCDFEGGAPIGEFELVKKISDCVGKENMLIKMHPRDTRTIYTDEGFHVDTNSSIPFEALMFAYDFEDKVLLTATSGAVLSANLMLKNPPETYYMYRLCDIEKNGVAKETVTHVDQILNEESLSDKLKRIHICDNIRDIVQ